VNRILERLPERCDAYIFYNSLRNFLASFSDGTGRKGGLIFSGVKNECPMKFTGASGAQSSILPMLDIFLGIKHENVVLKILLNDLVEYMPLEHRNFLKTIPPGILRNFIDTQKNYLPILPYLFDQIVEEIVNFRKKHLSYAAKFIVQQVKKSLPNQPETKPEVLGTGGTPFMQYLTHHLKETKRSQFGFKYSQTARVFGVMKDIHGLLPEWLRGPKGRVMDLEPQYEAERRVKMMLGVLLFMILVILVYCTFF